METLYNLKQKKLEEMPENADQMADNLKWKVEDLFMSCKAAHEMRIKDADLDELMVLSHLMTMTHKL